MGNAGRTRTALIIPALNEEDVIGLTLSRVPVALFDVIIVADNGSTDRTAEIARQAGATVVTEPERGYGAACLRAIEALPDNIEVVVFMQADASEDPTEARELVTPILEGRADLIIGSRTLGRAEPGSLLRQQRVGNWLATTLVRLLYGHRYTDLGPFRAIRLSALKSLDMRERTYGWTVEMQVKALQHGLRVIELPVSYAHRAAGTSKVMGTLRSSAEAGWRIFVTILRAGSSGRSA